MQTYLYSLISTHFFILTTNLHCRMQDISELFNPWVHGGGYKLRSLGLKCLGLRHPRLKRPETSQQYYFYLAFENSICPDYISEKFWRNLNQPVIPVVMGGGNYFRWRICRFLWALLTLITWPCKFWVSILSSFVGKKKPFCTNISFFVQYTWQNFGSRGLRLVKRSTQLFTRRNPQFCGYH